MLDCEAPVRARGLCMKHYRRQLGNGDPNRVKRIARGPEADDTRPRRCRLCGEMRRYDEYHVRQNSGTRRTDCMYCIRAKAAAHNARVKDDPATRLQRRHGALLRKYRITQDDYERMYVAQNGRCALCRRERPILAIDHDHKTGRVRDLLCTRCNTGIGWIEGALSGDVTRLRHYLSG